VSGGHTVLFLARSPTQFDVLGSTTDDAAGEAFDKVASILGLGYPGGPVIDAAAKHGNPQAVDFPRALLEPDSLDFSFSGLKTALVYTLKKMGYKNRDDKTIPPELVRNLAASFQEAVVQALVRKAFFALAETGHQELVVTGGVAANSRLREVLERKSRKTGIRVIIPEKGLCTDNAVMIAYAGTIRLNKGQHDPFSLNAVSRLSLESL